MQKLTLMPVVSVYASVRKHLNIIYIIDILQVSLAYRQYATHRRHLANIDKSKLSAKYMYCNVNTKWLPFGYFE